MEFNPSLIGGTVVWMATIGFAVKELFFSKKKVKFDEQPVPALEETPAVAPAPKETPAEVPSTQTAQQEFGAVELFEQQQSAAQQEFLRGFQTPLDDGSGVGLSSVAE